MFKISVFLVLFICSICFCMVAAAYGETLIIYSEKGLETCRFDVELAVTPAEQARGLMFRKAMDDHVGMFFIFNSEEVRHFWMRNTIIPLDMIFIGNNFLIVDTYKGAKPLDETVISSRKPARYVLEINAGKADKCRIKMGTKVKLLKTPF
jgi:uncharacterized protein